MPALEERFEDAQEWPDTAQLREEQENTGAATASANTIPARRTYGKTKVSGNGSAILGDVVFQILQQREQPPAQESVLLHRVEAIVVALESAATRHGITAPDNQAQTHATVARWIQDVCDATINSPGAWNGEMSHLAVCSAAASRDLQQEDPMDDSDGENLMADDSIAGATMEETRTTSESTGSTEDCTTPTPSAEHILEEARVLMVNPEPIHDHHFSDRALWGASSSAHNTSSQEMTAEEPRSPVSPGTSEEGHSGRIAAQFPPTQDCEESSCTSSSNGRMGAEKPDPISLRTLLQLYRKCKEQRFSDSNPSDPGRSEAMRALQSLRSPPRDFIFLLDDSETMQHHKYEVRDAVNAMNWLMRTRGCVRKDIDLCFMRASLCEKKDLTSHALDKVMRKVSGTTDLTCCLEQVLKDYVESYRDSRRAISLRKPSLKRAFLSAAFSIVPKLHPLSIYIITDAVWEPNRDPTSVIHKSFDQLGALDASDTQLTIQFISVQASAENETKLRRINDGLSISSVSVDTEPITGNVYKMLLGSLSRKWDETNSHVPIP